MRHKSIYKKLLSDSAGTSAARHEERRNPNEEKKTENLK